MHWAPGWTKKTHKHTRRPERYGTLWDLQWDYSVEVDSGANRPYMCQAETNTQKDHLQCLLRNRQRGYSDERSGQPYITYSMWSHTDWLSRLDFNLHEKTSSTTSLLSELFVGSRMQCKLWQSFIQCKWVTNDGRERERKPHQTVCLGCTDLAHKQPAIPPVSLR